jgi:hypothetical protein
MSALTDALAKPGPKLCSAAAARAALDSESAAHFDAWMAGVEYVDDDGQKRKWTDASIWMALQNLEFRVAQQTLGRHRRQQGECGCRP